MTFNDLKIKAEEYKRIPLNDLVARLDFKPPPEMPKVCHACGKQYGTMPWGWGDIAHELELGSWVGDKEYVYTGYCFNHNLYGKDEEEEAESLGDDVVDDEVDDEE